MKRRFSIFPKAFLLFFPLHLGAELITALGLLNKASGFYGILSIFTGHPLDAMEWILNIMSLLLLPVYAMAFLTVTQRNGLQMVLFAYIYVIDTFVSSIGMSIYFCVHWFKTKAKEMAANGDSNGVNTLASSVSSALASASNSALASESYQELASSSTSSAFGEATSSIIQSTSAYLVKRAGDVVEATATAASSSPATPSATPTAGTKSINKSASLAQETSVSIVIVVGLMLVRLYFSLCILSYARQLVRQQNLRPHNGQPKGSIRAKFQYFALSFCESFWTGYGSGYRSSTSSGMSDKSSSSTSLSSMNNYSNGLSEPRSAPGHKDEATTRLNQDF